MTLCPFDTLDGTTWINPAYVVSVRNNPTDAQRTDQPQTIIFTVDRRVIYVMPNPGRTAERLIEWSRGGDI